MPVMIVFGELEKSGAPSSIVAELGELWRSAFGHPIHFLHKWSIIQPVKVKKAINPIIAGIPDILASSSFG